MTQKKYIASTPAVIEVEILLIYEWEFSDSVIFFSKLIKHWNKLRDPKKMFLKIMSNKRFVWNTSNYNFRIIIVYFTFNKFV